MIRIIDATLANIDNHNPTKEDVLEFCSLMKEIGITDLELSEKIYRIVETLPQGLRFYMRIPCYVNQSFYPRIYKFIYYHQAPLETDITEFQMNDIREIVQLRAYAHLNYVRIVGMDDLMCHNYSYVMNEMKLILNKSKLIFSPENTFGCASALAVQWILQGGNEVTTTFCGYNNKAATEEVILALRITTRYKPNQELKVLPRMKEVFEKMTNTSIKRNKPVLGCAIFYVESGVHVDGIIKNPSNYEAYEPNIIGQETKIVIGKQSGLSSIREKLMEYQVTMPKEMQVLLLEKSKMRCIDFQRSLSDEEFIQLAREVKKRVGETNAC